MTWWQTLTVALATLVVTKLIDLIISTFTERKEFYKYRRQTIYAEIEHLKDEVGILIELSANWKVFDEKQETYIFNFGKDHELVGKYNKYPKIANAARDAVHWCKIVASCEKNHADDLVENKNKLQEKYCFFLQVCDEYVNSMA